MNFPEYAGHGGGLTEANSRGQFIKAAYSHLAVAILAFAVLSFGLYASGASFAMLKMLGVSKWGWLAVMGAFMVVGWLATNAADNSESTGVQYLALGGFVFAESLIFAPMLAMASIIAPGSIQAASVATLALVAGLTFTAFTSKKDFSFLGGFLKIGGLVAIGIILAGVVFGFKLGIWFSGAMVLFAGACVLYDTSQIMRHYPADRPAGAALHLFASVALLFWYVLRLIMSLTGNDD